MELRIGDRPVYPEVGDVVKMKERGVEFVVESVRAHPRFEGFQIIKLGCMHRHKSGRRKKLSVGSWFQLIPSGAFA